MNDNDIQPADKQSFYQQVWLQVHKIPAGVVATYGPIAKLIPTPAGTSDEDYQIYGPRWIGMAMAACPDDVPWQRVINSQGKISHQKNADKQKQLLQTEGVVFIDDRVNLREYQWRGPGQHEHHTQGRLF